MSSGWWPSTRRWVGVVVMAIGWHGLAAAGPDAPTDPTADPTTDSAKPAADVPEGTLPEIRLVDPGSGRKRPLRWRYQVGDVRVHTVSMGVSLVMEAFGMTQEQVVPEVTVRMRREVVSVSEDGKATVSWEVVAFDVALPEGAESTVELQEGLEQLAGIRGTEVLDAQGRRLQRTVMGGSATEQQQAALASLAELESRSLLYLPDQPVGRGAQWTVTLRENEQGLPVDATTTWTLTRRRGPRATLAIDGSQSAVEGASPQGALGDARVTDFSLASSAAGEATVDHRHLGAGSLSVVGELAMTLQMEGPGPGSMTMKAAYAVQVSSAGE